MNYYEVAKILNTHGLKGELKLYLLTNQDRFFKGSRLYIKYKNEYIEVTVKYSKDYKKGILVVFDGLEDINLVEKYKNSLLYIAESDQGELEEGNYYYKDLIGKEIYNQDDKLRGKVTDVEEVMGKYNLVIDSFGKTKRVPFIMNVFIKEITDSKIIINEIEGLF